MYFTKEHIFYYSKTWRWHFIFLIKINKMFEQYLQEIDI